jgi:hypothetical protein
MEKIPLCCLYSTRDKKLPRPFSLTFHLAITPMKIHRYILLTFAGLLFISSCTSDFDEINTNPNDPTTISPQFLLPYAIETSVDRYWGHRTRFERLNLDGAMLWMQYLARNIYSNEGDNYSISPALHANNWKGFYNDGLVNFQRIITLAGAEGNTPNANYEGVALVMRSWVFSILADSYGAIPYSQALKGTAREAIASPEYDSQEQVYAGLLNDLKLANEKLIVGGPAIAGDILYSGDMLKWKKFANSLRLRLANRQAAKKPAESKAIMAEILADPATYPVFTGNDDNAIVRHTAVLPSNNEWHQVMVQDGRTDWNISQTLADKLNSLNDKRIEVYAQPNSGKYSGIPNGLPDAIATTYLSTASKLGTRFMMPNTPSVIMTYSELQFILAEAAIDGDIPADAQVYFEKGIRASFDVYTAANTPFQSSTLGIVPLVLPDGYMDNYLATVGAVTREKIMEQKWIALFGQGVEAWTEYRRTGLPAFPARDPRAVFDNNGVLPTRLRYPSSEESLNGANMRTGISLNGGDNDMETRLWWTE